MIRFAGEAMDIPSRMALSNRVRNPGHPSTGTAPMPHRSPKATAGKRPIEVPHSHPQQFVDMGRTLLSQGGFTIFTFNSQEVSQMSRSRGWSGWLTDRGYNPETAEPVWFESAPGMGASQVILLLGALHRSAKT